MKIVHNGKVYNTETAIVIYYDGKTETMYYTTAKGSFFSIADTGEFKTCTEVEVMDEYLNYVGIDNFAADDEVNEVLKNLMEYAKNLEDA